MTVLDQVLEAEIANETAINAAKEAAAKTVAAAKVAKQTAIAKATTDANATIESVTVAAQTKSDTEAADIMTAAQKEAATVQQVIASKSTALVQSVVDIYYNAAK